MFFWKILLMRMTKRRLKYFLENSFECEEIIERGSYQMLCEVHKSDEEIKIAKATGEDVATIMDIMDTVLSLVPDKSWYCTDGEDFMRRHIEEKGFTLKAVVDDKTAGFLTVRFPGDDSDNLGDYINLPKEEKQYAAHMESAAVLPSYRGMGIQKKLMAQGEEFVRKTEYKYLMGTAHPDNVFSVNNFLKSGYEIVAEDEKYGGYPRYVFFKRCEANSS